MEPNTTELDLNEQKAILRIAKTLKSQGMLNNPLDYLEEAEVICQERNIKAALQRLVAKGYLHKYEAIDDLISLTPQGLAWAKNNKAL